MIRPEPLCPGAVVRVIAPSGRFEPTLAWRGLAWLSTHYQVRFDRRMFSAHGYLAGDDARRQQELEDALRDSEARAILAMRGGYGLHRIVHNVDWSYLRRYPKWLVGFSDITALHVEASAAGVMSLHACMVAQLGRAHEPTRASWRNVLEQPGLPARWDGLECWKPGDAQGPLFGGNLAVLHGCAVAGRLRTPPRGVLLLEDVGERPYRLDRMLTTMVAGGHLEGISGVVLGSFVECPPGPDGVTAEVAIRSVLSAVGVPIAAGLPVGHGEQNEPVILGSSARLEARSDNPSLTLT